MRNTSVLCLLLLGGCAAVNETLPRSGVLRARTVPHANGTIEPVSFKVNAIQSLSLGSPCETNDRMAIGTVSPEQMAPMPRATSPGTSVPIPNACAVTVVPGLKSNVPDVLRRRQPVQAPPKAPQP